MEEETEKVGENKETRQIEMWEYDFFFQVLNHT